MDNKVLDPSTLKSAWYEGYGRCIIKFRETREWRKAKLIEHTWVHMMYKFDIEPDASSVHYPDGGVYTLDLDNRWNNADVIDIRLVPNEMWTWDVPKPYFTEAELFVRKLNDRLRNGEKVQDESRKKEASDWKKIQIGNDAKYGCVMYSPSLDIMRKQTIDEFYGGGIVD